jgi:hypothetical protein
MSVNLVDTYPIKIKFGDKILQFDHAEAIDNEKLGFRSHGIFKREIENKWDELKYDVSRGNAHWCLYY